MADGSGCVCTVTRHHGEFGATHTGHCTPGADMEAAAGGGLRRHDRFDTSLVKLQVQGGCAIARTAAHTLQRQHRIGLQLDNRAIRQLDADKPIGRHL